MAKEFFCAYVRFLEGVPFELYDMAVMVSCMYVCMYVCMYTSMSGDFRLGLNTLIGWLHALR